MAGPQVGARPLAAQLLRLSALDLPGARGAVVDRGAKLRFDFSVRPFVGAREYGCRLELERAARGASAYVLKPDLQPLASGRRPPHIYDCSAGRTKLCLYTPDDGDWHPSMWLSETMVPWAIEWLRYFELWLIDGEWYGGGEHPKVEPRRRYGVRDR